MISERVRNPARWFKGVARLFGFSAMLFVVAVCAVGGIGCAEETFKCCECKFTCKVPDPAADPLAMPPTPPLEGPDLTLCGCPSEGWTYEECGVYCQAQAAADIAAATAAPVCDCSQKGCKPPCYDPKPGAFSLTPTQLTACSTTPNQDTSIAKDSCSRGSPVGE